MGTQPNTNPDHRLFARPVPGAGGSDWVEVVDDGGRPPSSARGQSDADGPAAAIREDTGYAAADAAARDAGGRRFNPYFCAAWAVAAVMLGAGLVWLFGSLQMGSLYGVNSQAMTRESLAMVNFQMMGPYLLPFGLAGTLALLTVQAAGYRNTRRD